MFGYLEAMAGEDDSLTIFHWTACGFWPWSVSTVMPADPFRWKACSPSSPPAGPPFPATATCISRMSRFSADRATSGWRRCMSLRRCGRGLSTTRVRRVLDHRSRVVPRRLPSERFSSGVCNLLHTDFEFDRGAFLKHCVDIGGGTRNRTRIHHLNRSPSARTQSRFWIIWPNSWTFVRTGPSSESAFRYCHLLPSRHPGSRCSAASVLTTATHPPMIRASVVYV